MLSDHTDWLISGPSSCKWTCDYLHPTSTSTSNNAFRFLFLSESILFAEVSFSLISQLPGYVQLPSVRYLPLQHILFVRIFYLLFKGCCWRLSRSCLRKWAGGAIFHAAWHSRIVPHIALCNISHSVFWSCLRTSSLRRVSSSYSLGVPRSLFSVHRGASKSLKTLVVRGQTACFVLRQRHPYRSNKHRLYRDACVTCS